MSWILPPVEFEPRIHHSPTSPEVIKLFFMLNSAEHEIFHADKSQITNNAKLFLAEHNWAWKFLS